MVQEDTDVVINVAASVDFNLVLDQALQINCFGGLRALELAEGCKNLKMYCHVSTAYVGCNTPDGSICKEEVEEPDFDVKALINKMLSMPVDEIRKQSKNFVGKYPNTYTYTKNLGEKMIRLTKKPETPCVIVRPTCVGCSLLEPVPGWIDVASSCGAFIHSHSLGHVQSMYVKPKTKLDNIPVDFVSNTCLAASAWKACQPGLTVVFSSTVYASPLPAGDFYLGAMEYMKN